jgi:tetratricopeptide (TPR) repeat protein
MPSLAAEDSFKMGLSAFTDERYARALEHFDYALQAERRREARFPDPRYVSYYGVSLARAGGADAECLRLCELAARRDPWNAAILSNLARVYVMAGRHDLALGTLRAGLARMPGHPLLERELDRTDRRGRPVLGHLDRSHRLNCWLGRLRARASDWNVQEALATF